MPDTHLILYHKQSTSARTRFLRFRHGGVCGPEPLPADATVDDPGGGNAATLLTHPGMLLRATETALDLARGSLASDAGFHCRVFAGADSGDVYLAHFTSIDPPFEAADAAGAAFIDLTQARGLPPAELALLRLAYEHVLG
jgi:hypothetical protein